MLPWVIPIALDPMDSVGTFAPTAHERIHWRQEPASWFVRVALGAGTVLDSPQERVLKLEGYDGGTRAHATLDGAWYPWSHVGVGAWVAYSNRDTESNLQGPTLTDTVVVGAAEVPVAFGNRSFRLLVLPRVGVARARESVHDSGRFVTAPAFGLELAAVWPRAYIGIALGAYSVPAPPPGELGSHANFGSLYALLSFYIEG